MKPTITDRHWGLRFIWSLVLGAWTFARPPWAWMVLWLASCPCVTAQETNAFSSLDYPSFRIISERNIFNPNRSSRSVRKGEPERQIRIESFTLLGTLSYEKGSFAFFEGTSPAYRKVLQPADTIAGHKIVEIAPSHVKLEAGGREIELRVGSQMKREDEGDWEVSERAEPSGNSGQTTASVEKTDAGPSSAAGAGTEESDVLKRLLQKREQETKNENR